MRHVPGDPVGYCLPHARGNVCVQARVGRGGVGGERKSTLIFKNASLTSSSELRISQAPSHMEKFHAPSLTL